MARAGNQALEKSMEPQQQADFKVGNSNRQYLVHQVGVTVAGHVPRQLVASPPCAHHHPSFLSTQVPPLEHLENTLKEPWRLVT